MNNWLTRWAAQQILKICRRVMSRREPDVLIAPSGETYLERWHLIPRNRLCNIYLHRFLMPDDDRALHDHPWQSVSLLLSGTLREFYCRSGNPHTHYVAERDLECGSLVYRGARFSHRLAPYGDDVVTLFITGPRIRRWGFWCPAGWRYWQDFTTGGGERIGRGCE